MDKILTITNLEKSFHTRDGEIKALESVSFDVREKEFISIVGPSGCGKSTILSILAGLEEKSNGEINFSKDYTIGYMLQNDSLFEWRTVLENCLLGLEITNQLTKENKEYNKSVNKRKQRICNQFIKNLWLRRIYRFLSIKTIRWNASKSSPN